MAPKGVKRSVVKDGELPVRLRSVLSVTGGVCKAQVLLPTMSFGGQSFAKVSTRAEWLNRLVAGGCRGALSCNQSVADLLGDIKAAKQAALKALSSAEVETEKKTAAAVCAGRAAVGLSDSETEESAQVAARPAGKKHKRVTMVKVLKINVRGTELKVFNNLAVTWVLATEEQMAKAVALFQEAHQVVAANPPKAQGSFSADDIHDIHKGKVVYMFLDKCFQISFVDEKGKRCTSRKGLQVPTTGLDGRFVSAERLKSHIEMVRQKAREAWNTMDKSEATRFSKP
jgi:hypothetical protein